MIFLVCLLLKAWNGFCSLGFLFIPLEDLGIKVLLRLNFFDLDFLTFPLSWKHMVDETMKLFLFSFTSFNEIPFVFWFFLEIPPRKLFSALLEFYLKDFSPFRITWNYPEASCTKENWSIWEHFYAKSTCNKSLFVF